MKSLGILSNANRPLIKKNKLPESKKSKWGDDSSESSNEN
jgi:hypothetical protein